MLLGAAFSVSGLLSYMGDFIKWLFVDDGAAGTGGTTAGAVGRVLGFITENEILWVFLALAICTLAIGVLARIRKIF